MRSIKRHRCSVLLTKLHQKYSLVYDTVVPAHNNWPSTSLYVNAAVLPVMRSDYKNTFITFETQRVS